MKQVKPNAWNGHFAIIPANFPAGYEERNGLYFKTDAEGNVTEIRNLFGCDITASADINLLFGCKPKSEWGRNK